MTFNSLYIEPYGFFMKYDAADPHLQPEDFFFKGKGI